MIGRRCLALLVPIGISIAAIGSFSNRAHPGGVGVSLPPHPTSLQGTQAVTTPFQFYRVPQEKSPRAWRDLEFLTSRSYENYARALSEKYNGSDLTELDKLGITICDDPGTNPFGFHLTDIRMAYDYFARRATAHGNFRDSLYNYDEQAQVGLKVWKPEWSDADADRSDIDTYVYLPKFTDDGAFGSYAGDSAQAAYAQTPSFFFSPLEDSTTGKFGLHLDEWHENSIHIPGPKPSQVGDPNPATHWARANALQSWGFNHEFTHSINYRTGSEGTALSEIFSSAAEQIGGELPEPPRYEVPFSWGLLRTPTGGLNNYQAWRGFSAYLANHFRGVDTMATGYRDHLLLRWAGKEPEQARFARLADRLSAAECAECTLKTYLQGLPPVDRRELVIHNWRIAMFANRHELAENQYGFVPHLGFDPVRDLGTWRGFVDSTESDDSVSVPHELILSSAHLTRGLTLAGSQADLGGQQTYRSTTLEPRGADYWVLRPDPSLGSARRTLVIQITTELPCQTRRLMASAILYREHVLAGGQADSLWKHPEWVREVDGPHWVDIADGVGAVSEIVIDDFGDSTKAVVVVVTLGESGPLEDGASTSGAASVRYRMRVGFRSGAYLYPNPAAIYAEPTWEDWPAFSPAGDTLAFAVYDPEVSQRRIYRAPVAGGAPGLLVQPPGSADEDHPDWSPRGDWVAIERAVSPTQSDLWAYSVRGLGLRQLTSSSLHDYAPSFSPNGQHVAYLRISSGGGREVRSVSISGTGDALLVSRGTDEVVGPRWAPDGQHVHFVANDTLYSVAVSDRAVAARRYLGSDVRSFDLPLGLERLVVERVLTDKYCASLSSFPSTFQTLRRVFLVDTLSGQDEMIFYRPRTRTISPRWASSGTRLAFATNPLQADSCDIRIGQVRNNHAPLLHDVGQFHEMDVYAHVPFSYDFSATDSDGEPITFRAAYLPDSATFHPTTGVFSWPNPRKTGADSLYFIVFRALDPSGGVYSYVTRFRVMPQTPPPGGCPFVDVHTADGWITDNSILGRSRTGEPGLDAYRLQQAPVVRGNRIQLRIREDENELTTLDQVRLLAVDRDPSLTLMSAGGELHWGTRVPAWRVTTSRGEDLTSLVTGQPGSMGWQGSPGDTVLIEMTDPASGRFGLTGTQDGGGGTGEGSDKYVELRWDPSSSGGRYTTSPTGELVANPAMATDATWLDQTGIRVQVPDGSGGWQDLAHWYPARTRTRSTSPASPMIEPD